MAIPPLALIAVMWFQHSLCATLLQGNPGLLVEIGLMMTVAFATSVYGTHMVVLCGKRHSRPGDSGNTVCCG